MIKKCVYIAAVILTGLFAGCATPTDMAFQDEDESVDKIGKPIFLMTASLKNDYRAFYQPELLVVNVEKNGAKDRSGRINFTMDKKTKDVSETTVGNNYFLRLALENGDYVINGLTGYSGLFPVRGNFFAPLNLVLPAKNKGVFYIGHISATVRERQGNEFRAGSIIPLVDQAVTGFSGGTFEIAVMDKYEQDVPAFVEKFPALKNIEIQKAILPAFDREKVQKLWEAQ